MAVNQKTNQTKHTVRNAGIGRSLASKGIKIALAVASYAHAAATGAEVTATAAATADVAGAKGATVALAGGLVLLVADIACRVVLAPQQLPVGVMMALFGVPVFLWLLQRRSNRC